MTRVAAFAARLLLYLAGTLLLCSLALCALAVYLSTLPARRLSSSSHRRAAKLAAARQLVLAIATIVALTRERAGAED
jgi:hypothetical protein